VDEVQRIMQRWRSLQDWRWVSKDLRGWKRRKTCLCCFKKAHKKLKATNINIKYSGD
jgi:hypothetical protein